MRAINRYAGDIQRLRENQRNDFDAHLQRLSGKERGGAEFGIVADGEILGGERASEQREAQIPQLDFASQSGGRLLLDGGAEFIDGDQERRNQD